MIEIAVLSVFHSFCWTNCLWLLVKKTPAFKSQWTFITILPLLHLGKDNKVEDMNGRCAAVSTFDSIRWGGEVSNSELQLNVVLWCSYGPSQKQGFVNLVTMWRKCKTLYASIQLSCHLFLFLFGYEVKQQWIYI